MGSITKPVVVLGLPAKQQKRITKKSTNQPSIRKSAVVLHRPAKQQLIGKNAATNDSSISQTVVLDRPKQQQQLIRKNDGSNNMNGSCFDSCSEEDATLSSIVSFLEETLCLPKSVLKEDSTTKKLIRTEHPGVTKKRKTEHLCLGDRIAASYKTKNVKAKSTILSKKLNQSTDGLTKKSTSDHIAPVRTSREKRKPDLIENNQLVKKRKTENCRLEANKKKDTPGFILATNTVPSCLTEAMEYAKRREERATGISLRYKLLNEERVAARALRDAMEREVVIVDNFQVMKDYWKLIGSDGDGVVMGPCRIYR